MCLFIDYIKEYFKSIFFISKNFVKHLVLASISGLIVGLVISFFSNSLQFVTITRKNSEWIFLLLPISGLVISQLYCVLGKDVSRGTNLVIEYMNNKDVDVPFRMAPLVFVSTIITHLFGGSAGSGTAIQIGAGICSGLGKLFRLKPQDFKIVLISGVSSGFAAMYGVPVGGTIFGLEVGMPGKMKYEAFVPCLISSFVGSFVSNLFNVSHMNYKMVAMGNKDIPTIIKVFICAILFGLLSKLFSELNKYFRTTFISKIKNQHIRIFVGGCVVVVLVLIVHDKMYLGLSSDLLKASFTQKVVVYAFIIKLLISSITLTTGYQGGEITPLFVIGATFANVMALVVGLPDSFLAGLGMLGVFCGGTRTPIATFAMGIELFGVGNIEYIFITCVISYIFAGRSGVYISQEDEIREITKING